MGHAHTLHATTIAAPGRRPERTVLFLHGILGSGNNLRQIARGFVDAFPNSAAVLVDLRLHGRSLDFPPPHTVHACAEDLLGLADTLPAPVRGIWGHSFGGKVALEFANQPTTDLEHAWIIDTTPGRGSFEESGEVYRVFQTLEALPTTFATREAFVAAVETRGHAITIAQWLAKNLESTSDGFRFSLCLSALRALLDDYFARDLWPVIEAPPGSAQIHLIVGGRSAAFTAVDRARGVRAAMNPRVTYDEVPGAGHWVHADAPEAVLELVRGHPQR